MVFAWRNRSDSKENGMVSGDDDSTHPLESSIGMVTVAVGGTAFFFAIVGVFGLWNAIGSLALLIAISVLCAQKPQR